MFRFLRAYGVLKRDVFVECNALELKGEVSFRRRGWCWESLGV
jgi:hypothetical protein